MNISNIIIDCKDKKQHPKLIIIFTKSFPEFAILYFCEVVMDFTFAIPLLKSPISSE